MKIENWVTAAITSVLVISIGATAGAGVYIHSEYGDLTHGEPFSLPAPARVAEPISSSDDQRAEVDTTALVAALEEVANSPALGTFHATVSDATTSQLIWERDSDRPLTPASITKVLTAAAAILTQDLDSTLETAVVSGERAGEVVIRASGDVWLDDDRLDDLAEQIQEVQPEVDQVKIDTSIWAGEEYLPGWDPTNIDGGYVAPLQPAMINGGRIGAETGDVPRSHTPAFDVAAGLASRLGAPSVAVGPAPQNAEVIATTQSPTLEARLKMMMQNSDNVMAEAIGRSVAIANDYGNTPEAAHTATLDILTKHGFNIEGTVLEDNSGLSSKNLIAPRLIGDIIMAAATGASLRPLLETLPVAHGNGTLEERYAELPGRGYVRAKTGTLTGINGLAGTVVGDSGHIYTFALLSNDADILGSRAAVDEFASVLKTY